MKRLPAALTTVLSILALSSIGCVETPDYRARPRSRSEIGDGASTPKPDETEQARASLTVNGQIDGATGATVTVLALGDGGELTPVADAEVRDGAFQVDVPQGASSTDVFILRVKDLAGAIVGGGVVNGVPAFFQAIVVDATVDASTSFKSEILVTLAKKGVPGVQNYLNVIDAYVNAQFMNAIVVDGVFTNDFNTIVGAASDAVLAAEDAIVDALGKAGIVVDIDALQAAQVRAVAGLSGIVTSAAGERTTAAKSFLASLQAATARAAAPIDQAIFNAIVNGSATFRSSFGEKAPGAVGFAAAKSSFALETELSTGPVADAFSRSALGGKVSKACAAFTAAVADARSSKDLEAARSAFTAAILGEDDRNVFAPFLPLAAALATAFVSLDPAKIADALAKIDEAVIELPRRILDALDASDVPAVRDALRLVQKQVAQ